MGRRRDQVNGRRWLHCGAVLRAAAGAAIVAAGIVSVACFSDEGRAERLYRDAARQVERGDIAGAIARLETIVRRYPDTATAETARREIVVYTGLRDAVTAYPRRRTQDAAVQIARALDRYRAAHGTWPDTLENLAPAEMAGVPDDGWGRPYRYARRGPGYRLESLGSDDRPAGDGDAGDVVVIDGRFVEGAP